MNPTDDLPYSKLPPYTEMDTNNYQPLPPPSAPPMMPCNVIMQSAPAPAPTIIHVSSGPTRNASMGACAACNTGVLRNNYSLCAWCLCCWFFPCGILCCLCMRRKKCSHCGVTY